MSLHPLAVYTTADGLALKGEMVLKRKTGPAPQFELYYVNKAAMRVVESMASKPLLEAHMGGSRAAVLAGLDGNTYWAARQTRP